RALAALEPDLASACAAGLWLEGEGQIDNHAVMDAMARALDASSVELCLGTPVRAVAPYRVELHDRVRAHDLVIDCRGLGARADLRDLRGVRGELIELHAPEARLSRPVRILHQRYPIYVAPRGPERFVVGATCIESE